MIFLERLKLESSNFAHRWNIGLSSVSLGMRNYLLMGVIRVA